MKIMFEEFANGGMAELLNKEINRVMENIHNLDTKATNKRAVELKINFTPNEERDDILIDIEAKSKLAPVRAISTKMATGTKNGKVVFKEYFGMSPQQVTFSDLADTEETEQPIKFENINQKVN